MDEKQNETVQDQETEPVEEKVTDEASGNRRAGDAPCSETTQPEPCGEEQAEDSGELNRLKQELVREKARAEEYYGRFLRAQADFDNFRKRTLKEKEELRKYASELLVEALLPVLDNFGRALKTSPGDGEKLLEGVQMIYHQLEEVLKNEGLQAISAVGEEFDPNKHEAVMQEQTDEYPDNSVIEEMRKGYFFKDKLIRPAMVKVARST